MSVEVRVTAKGEKRWRVRIFRQGRIVTTQTFDRRSDAVRFEAEWKSKLSLGVQVARDELQHRSVQWWSERYFETKTFAKYASERRERSVLEHHVLPAFGSLPVRLISKSEVKRWVVKLTEVRSPDTARLSLGVLRRVLEVAKDDHVIASNPAAGVKVHGVRPGTARVLTYEELSLISEQIADVQHRTLFLLLAFTGLRWSEAVALTWADLSENSVSVTKARELGEDGKYRLGSTKTHSVRDVPIPSFLNKRLGLLWEVQGHGSAQWWWRSAPAVNDLVFPSKRGSYIDRSNYVNRILTPACERAGIAKVTPHQLRDTYISLALSAGAVVTAVSKNVGHASPDITFRHYAAPLQQDRQEVAKMMDVFE